MIIFNNTRINSLPASPQPADCHTTFRTGRYFTTNNWVSQVVSGYRLSWLQPNTAVTTSNRGYLYQPELGGGRDTEAVYKTREQSRGSFFVLDSTLAEPSSQEGWLILSSSSLDRAITNRLFKYMIN